MENELQNKQTVFYFIYTDETLAGYMKLNVGDAQSEQQEDGFEVERLYIYKDYHRMGFGKALMDYAIEKAKTLQTSYIWLGVWEENPNAIAFYKNQGFESFGDHIFQIGDDAQRDILMRKSLF